MNLKKVLGLAVTTLVLNAVFIVDAGAVSIDVKCEKRPNRSKISVEGGGLANAQYKAVVRSGGVALSSAPKQAQFGEVEIDFDSNANDVSAGATAILANFIVNNKVSAEIQNSAGATVASANNVVCRTK